MPGPIAWSVLGAVIGAARYATIFGVMLLVQPPRLAWALLLPGLALHTTFGILSGWVSWQLVRAMKTARDDEANAGPKLTLEQKTANSEAK
jgi:hypothetical protein